MEIKIHSIERLAAIRRPPDYSGRHVEKVGDPAPSPIVVLDERVLVATHDAAIAADHEVCGLLLGTFVSWSDRDYVEVTRALAGTTTDAGASHVKFTASTWSSMLEVKEREHSSLTIVGWYHSHPHLGVFMSSDDLEIQRAFFPEPWQLGLVIDPHLSGFGLFVNAQNDVIRLDGFHFVRDQDPAAQASHTITQAKRSALLRPGGTTFIYARTPLPHGTMPRGVARLTGMFRKPTRG